MHALGVTALSIYPVSRWSRGDPVSWGEGSICGLPVLYGLSVSLVHTSCGLERRESMSCQCSWDCWAWHCICVCIIESVDTIIESVDSIIM